MVNANPVVDHELMCELCPTKITVRGQVTPRREGENTGFEYIVNAQIVDSYRWRLAGGSLYTWYQLGNRFFIEPYRLAYDPTNSENLLMPEWGYGIGLVFWVCPTCCRAVEQSSAGVEYLLLYREQRMKSLQSQQNRLLAELDRQLQSRT